MSLDGFIARKNGDLDWMSVADMEGEDYGYEAFTADVDAYIIGRKTYDKVIELTGTFPQARQFECYVFTRTPRESVNDVTFYTGSPVELIQQLRSKPGKTIYCDGGGEMIQLLMSHKLIDEMIISILPVALGDGLRLFRGDVPEVALRLIESKTYRNGLLQVHYEVVR